MERTYNEANYSTDREGFLGDLKLSLYSLGVRCINMSISNQMDEITSNNICHHKKMHIYC